MNRIILSSLIAFYFVNIPVLAQVAFDETAEVQHERAVELARQEKYTEAMAILDAILARDPGNYPVRRDYVVIATWMDRCDIALKHYEKIKKHQNQESYLISPVANCLADAGKMDQALEMLAELNRRGGDDESQDTQQRLKRRFALDRRPVADAAASTTKSEAGTREWGLSARLKLKHNERMAWYLRYLHARAVDPKFETGDFNRIGGGIIYGLHEQATLIQDIAAEIDGGSSFGSTTTLVLTPTIALQGQVEYATYAEDVSLRARAVGIKTDRFTASANYHTPDYRWESSSDLAFYNFTDGNERSALNASLGYGFELAPRREQRVIGSLSYSTNTLDDTLYFNPERDFTTMLTYKLDLVYVSRFPRHVDHFFAHLGMYSQARESPNAIYGVRYEQDYDFSDVTSLTWGTALRSSVYDGNREFAVDFNVSVSRKL